MSTSEPNIRAIKRTLPDLHDERVVIIGKLDKLDGNEATFLLSDGPVLVHVGSAIDPMEIGRIYEVLGKVVDDSSIKAYTARVRRATELPNAEFEEKLIKMRSGQAAAIFSG